MDLEALRMFAEVAHRGSFSAVARERCLQASSITRVIAGLEHELGERLFHRTTRKLNLTEAGTLFLTRIEPLIAHFDEGVAEVRAMGRGPFGTIRMSVSVAYGMERIVPLLTEFRERFPNLSLELILDDAQADLVRDSIDLAIRLGPSIDGNVIVSRLEETRYRVVASRDWLEAHQLANPLDLAQHHVLRLTLPGYRDRWVFQDKEGNQSPVTVSGPILISNALALRDAAIAGLGPALLAVWTIQRHLANGTLIDCFPDLEVTATDFDTSAWAIYPSRSFLPNKVRVTLDFLREKLSLGAVTPAHNDG
jgi:DNA-binding transcriptional LysR family regulator